MSQPEPEMENEGVERWMRLIHQGAVEPAGKGPAGQRDRDQLVVPEARSGQRTPKCGLGALQMIGSARRENRAMRHNNLWLCLAALFLLIPACGDENTVVPQEQPPVLNEEVQAGWAFYGI